MIPNQRHLFDMPDEIAYLNCAYMSPLMDLAAKAAGAGVRYKVQPWTYAGSQFFTHTEQVRALAAKLINARADDIALVPSASYGLQIAANNLKLTSSGEILIIKDQFPSNVYPWRDMIKTYGGLIHTVDRPENGDWTSAVLEAIGARTEIIALPATHWADGGVLDLQVIGAAARRIGAKFVLDLTQSLGAMPFDIETIQPDFMVCAGYKWMMGPYTLSYLYVAPQHQNRNKANDDFDQKRPMQKEV